MQELGEGRTAGHLLLPPASQPCCSGRPKAIGELEFSSQTDEPLGLYNSSAAFFTAGALFLEKEGKTGRSHCSWGPTLQLMHGS